jgi:hypothetical protein
MSTVVDKNALNMFSLRRTPLWGAVQFNIRATSSYLLITLFNGNINKLL